jgi:hypothetical protein
MDGSVNSDSAKDVAIAQRTSSQRELDLVPFGRMVAGRLLGRGQGEPRIASQAPVPTQPATLSSEQGILIAQLLCVGSDQLVAVKSASDQFVSELGTKALWGFGAGRMPQMSLHPRCLPDASLSTPSEIGLGYGYVPSTT